MFENFDESMIEVEAASILTRHCGAGDLPVLLLRGHPRTSATWHRVAPLLVDAGHTVVCPDLRGYGRSQGPAPTPDHSAHSKRAMASDMVQVMAALGHRRFAVVGHDRGSYVALRLSLDHPSLVAALSLLDCIPSASTSTGRTVDSRPDGGTGSSTPSPTSPSAPSLPIPLRGTAAIRPSWEWRTTVSG
ncbi:alpha/beta fold hydrolase [Rhodococcus sp. BP-241]|uniref:alpha/beta fold hydrolase n=1 Tax=Rhodococcus sp. BP-241 TaxID=2739441 RepID=UPI001C9ADADA|nr:alpha/beta fold hydrolase [Rhodococcus sp. BP-241]